MITVNGISYPYQADAKTILDILRKIDVNIPTLCHDSRLMPAFSCRTCLVKVNNGDKLLPACKTALSDNMTIETHLPFIEDYRKEVIRMLAARYPLEVVQQEPDKEFHHWLNHYGLVREMSMSEPGNAADESHPYLSIDMTRCIKCYRCVNICRDVQGQSVWHIVNRGDESKIISDSKGPFSLSSCVSCGACANTCPTGAISDKQALQNGKLEKTVRTVCAYCGVGCEIEVGVKNNAIISVHPAMNAPVNKGHLCVKGRYAWEYTRSKDRILNPMIRTNNEWKIVSWTDAINYCTEKFKSISKQSGPDSMGVLGSARATNEDNYVIQKFTRTVLGTNNIDCCARVCHQPSAKAMSMVLGTGAATNSFDDIEKAKTILLVGSNVTEAHPVVGARIKQSVRKGAKLIVIDPRKIELAGYAHHHLALKPGTNVALLNAMAHVIVEENLYDREFMKDRVANWAEYREFLSAWTPARAAKICKILSRLICEAARLYASERPSICFHGLGVTEHIQGTEGVLALINLVLLTGNIGKPGTGINPLRGQNNVQGSAAMGCDPSVFPGMASVKSERTAFEKLWKTSLPSQKGLTLPEMLESAIQGKLKALWAVGYDVFPTMPNATNTRHALNNLDFLIVQDMFMNETANQFAHVFLPVANSFEKEGTFMNAERRIQKIRKAISPPPEVKSDWEIIGLMAEGMGKKSLFPFTSAEDIWNEVRQAWKSVYGITYERLDGAGMQWPCPDINHPGTEILHTETFNGRKVNLSLVDFKPSPEETSSEFPFMLITGRKLYHFNSGTMTYRTPNKILSESDLLYIHPHDAEMIGLTDGSYARVTSQYGSMVLMTTIDKTAKKGEVFTTFSDSRVGTNKVTSHHRDHYVQTPEYKITAVRIEKLLSPETKPL